MSAGLVIVTEYRTEYLPELRLQKTATRNIQMFLKGRERRESDGPIVVIVQPDLRRELWLETKTHTFTVRPIFELATAEETRRWQKLGERYTQRHFPSRDKPSTHEITVHVEKTGETAEIFGTPAARYITRRTHKYHAGIQQESESVSDGWYIDVQHPALPKASRSLRVNVSLLSTGNEGPPVIRRTGELAYSGLPAKVVTTTRQTCPGPDGMREHTSTQAIEIVDFSKARLTRLCLKFQRTFESAQYSQVSGTTLGVASSVRFAGCTAHEWQV